MGEGHRRRGPEREQPAKIKRMTHVLVEYGSTEFDLRILSANQIKKYLPESEQVEMICVAGRVDPDQHDQPRAPPPRRNPSTFEARRFPVTSLTLWTETVTSIEEVAEV